MEPSHHPDAVTQRHLDGELRIIRQAILFVAAGGAPRVDVAGLRLAGALLADAERLAAGSGVRLVPLWTADEQLFDLRVERAEADA